MEENIYQSEHRPSEEMKITQLAGQHLAATAKWAKFIAIVGFVCAGLILIAALSASSWMSALSRMGGSYGAMYSMGAGAFTTTYLIAALLYFALSLFLYRFATKTQQALETRENDAMTNAFGQLKNYFQLNGILLIIALVFIALGILMGIVGGIAAAAAM